MGGLLRMGTVGENNRQRQEADLNKSVRKAVTRTFMVDNSDGSDENDSIIEDDSSSNQIDSLSQIGSIKTKKKSHKDATKFSNQHQQQQLKRQTTQMASMLRRISKEDKRRDRKMLRIENALAKLLHQQSQMLVEIHGMTTMRRMNSS